MIGSKFFLPVVGGVAMTLGLGQAMIKLIHVEFEAKSKLETIIFETEIIEPIERTYIKSKKPQRVANIDVPPRINPISNTTPDEPPLERDPKPVEPVKFPIDGLDISPIDSAVMDTNAQPIIRVGGKVPNKALREGRSGHCLMRFDVDSLGQPFNVSAYACSHSMFAENSVKATKKFKYLPKYKGGVPVNMTGVETKITYRVLDENGRLLPES